MKRRIAFWILVILSVAFLTDPIINIGRVLVENRLFDREGYPILLEWWIVQFDEPRDALRSTLLIATLIGLGAVASWNVMALLSRQARRAIFATWIIISAMIFRFAEFLTDALVISGICAGSADACPNEAMVLIGGSRFTVIAYLALGVAIVVGGILARKSWQRFFAPPSARAEVVAVDQPAAEETAAEPADKRGAMLDQPTELVLA